MTARVDRYRYKSSSTSDVHCPPPECHTTNTCNYYYVQWKAKLLRERAGDYRQVRSLAETKFPPFASLSCSSLSTSMVQAGASLLLFFATLLAILLPSLHFLRLTWSSTPRLGRGISCFLLLHSIFLAYSIILLPPPNIFTALRVPLSMPADSIRSLLLKNSDERELPRAIEQLLGRMGSFETRTLYVRFGHDVVASCEYCHSYGDFALFALATSILSYICEIAIVGVVTIRGTHRERHRTLGVVALICAAVMEGYCKMTRSIQIPNDPDATSVFMWHDNLLLLRRIVFLLLPVIIHLALPPSPPSSPTQTRTATTLQGLVTKLHLLKYTRGAIARTPSLRAASQEWWSREHDEGEWVRNDRATQDMAEKLGLGFNEAEAEEDKEEGKLRTSAKAAVKGLMNGFVPSDYWAVPSTSTNRAR
ncbi:uncharacterized protein BT62DRAFT_97226 [Guyanagaster necrorhizus]|uniref:Uncharacterized protein n=1 Tax=Guyanagaster necrorhizus TaxID=856835 RepID=A0A9P8AUK4_9AGAR|nr:uncharacterized protein BT62DRAFT_97226 [Guyanagaster necrorhizus MCA 3950]KAG7447007.1 hypothetical protein BT62DRAFT_97226 [Guyanagaster necrorhizus MCA 3950]